MYRTIYVAEPGHDVSALREHTGRIKFITSGLELLPELIVSVQDGLKEFDPRTDAIVPVGKVTTCLVIGSILKERFGKQPINIAVYREKNYTFYQLPGA